MKTAYDLMKEIYQVISGGDDRYVSKYEIALQILNVVEDYEASEHTGKDPKTATMSLFTNGNDRYYTFDINIASGDFLEGDIKINGSIPAGNFKAFVIDDEMAAILIGNNFSGQAVSLRKEGTKWISK